jgi:ribonuclease J
MNARKKHAHDKSLVFLPLGGTGEIGMNCYCYGTGSDEDREWLMVDLGVKFGGDAEPGIDVVLPDVHFIAKSRKKLSGLVLTHAHEDHIGGVPWLWPQLKCPIYCTPFAAALLANKLKEHGLDELVKVHVIPLRGKFKVGSFDLEFVNVTHSIPEPCALLIKTRHGIAFHSGDWKIDRTPTFGAGIDEKRLAEIGEEGVDVLICDSTNVLREGFSPSEQDVADALMEVVSHAKGRVAITTFASHVERVASAVRAARASGREVVLAGRAMRNTIEAAVTCMMPEPSLTRTHLVICHLVKFCFSAPAAKVSPVQQSPGLPKTSTPTSRWKRAIWLYFLHALFRATKRKWPWFTTIWPSLM